jgi:hypothetical protein
MRRLRTLAFGLILTVPAFVPAAVGSAAACAAEASGASHAALVVGTGSQTTTYCVALDASSVTGLHLIQLAGSQFGLQYQLGFGGQAVCQLAGVGAGGGDCFGSYPDFWGYWHGNGSGGWSWAGSGAGSASIGNGDMEGWVWGSGDSGTTHAAPPALAFDDVCKDSTPSPTPPPSPDGGGGGNGDGNGGGSGADGGDGGGNGSGPGTASSMPSTSASATPQGSSGPNSTHGDDPKDRSPQVDPSTGEVVEASPVTALAAGVTDDGGGGGPPVGALVALVGIAALGAGGWFLRRRQIDRGA